MTSQYKPSLSILHLSDYTTNNSTGKNANVSVISEDYEQAFADTTEEVKTPQFANSKLPDQYILSNYVCISAKNKYDVERIKMEPQNLLNIRFTYFAQSLQ